MLVKGLGINISNGHLAKFWMDTWLNCGPLLNFSSIEISDAKASLLVVSFCDEHGS